MAARNACQPAAVKLSTPQGVLKPALQSGDKPNFIVILSDDQGWDDIGLHNPRYVNTPNLDRFIRNGTLFDNFYVTPQCAQSRAALLTGRYPPRAGTMLVHGGWDYINSGEATAGEVMSAAGYHTAHYGKWHNGRTLGYEPWTVGFQDSWFPSSEFEDALMSHNGAYVQTKKWVDDQLMDQVLSFLDRRQTDGKPFFTYYAPHAIHTSRTGGPFKGKVYRSYPKEWRDKYDSDPKYAGIASATKDAWAMLEWLDGIYGRLFSFLESSPLGKNTYVMIMSDNGPQLLFGEKDGLNKMRRMPSNMEGAKSLPYDGGIRNFLAVQGPGVQAGVVDSTLLGLVDILPTVADLAGDTDAAVGGHLPWDGLSFKNLLATDSSGPEPSALRGSNLSNKKQQDRILFTLVPHCWDADAVPELDENREVNRSQLMLDYDRGGVPHSGYGDQIPGMKLHPGFQMCIAARYRDYKWMGFQPDKVYDLSSSHIELPCTELPQPYSSHVAKAIAAAARAWWQTVVSSPSSFTKPTYYLGMGNWTMTNMLADGAHERTPGAIRLLVNGAKGFYKQGDKMCFGVKVESPGTYYAVMFYTSKYNGLFKLSIGPHADIKAGKAPTIKAQLPPMPATVQGQIMGNLTLPSSNGKKWDACLELINPGAKPQAEPVFSNFYNIRMRRLVAGETLDVLQQPSDGGDYLLGDANMRLVKGQQPPSKAAAAAAAAAAANAVPVAVPAPSIDLQGHASWLAKGVQAEMLQDGYHNVTSLLRNKYRWPQGQGKLESMFSPYDAEDIEFCTECKPAV
ncbi:hypothetical protein OEZ85_014292 [Tetradesmus obliquus]|uniref:Sulfatase N-terminal domain-containing protein n=1 Tax=Tetradesmus obliquus TaxID=3088 RepID=A0ABY8U811_TETOB|nr:hypothetical protein OEZ85_014292 [Tetradesmus obliquus]